MKDLQALIDKILAQAEGERRAGNYDAATAMESRVDKLRDKYNLPAPEPEPEPVREIKAEVKPQKYSEDFPGVPPADGPLTNEQLASLRAKAASVGGRPLTDKELASVLGVEYSEPKRGDKCNYFEV
jgi:hypothetical protein